MVGAQGYIKIIDLGGAKILNESNFHKTFSIIGTPHYMAPEIIKGGGYGSMVDVWALGICCYEFICGSLPYGEDEEDPYKLY